MDTQSGSIFQVQNENFKINREQNLGFEKFSQATDPKLDITSVILKTHLLAEYHLDHVIVACLPRGDIVVEEERNFTFFNKLTIVEALSVIQPQISQSLKALNKLRNQCGHVLNYSINESDIDKIGRPLGQNYLELKQRHASNLEHLLRSTLMVLIAKLDAISKFYTDKKIQEHPIQLDTK